MLDVLGEAALRSAVVTAIAWCVLRLLRVRQARLLLSTWTVVLLASVAMPGLPPLVPLRLAVGPAIPAPLTEHASVLLQPFPDIDAIADASVPVAAWPWMKGVYAVVCCGMLLRVALGVALSARLLARAVPVRPAWAAGQRIRLSRDATGPVTIAHVILLPADAVTWSAEIRQAVLAHERAHVARCDYAMLILSQLHRAVFWFSPLPWWLHRRLVTLSELASDDQAMASTGDRLRYAEILLEMGRRSRAVSRGPAMARPSTLLRRIDRILLDRVSLQRPSWAQHAISMGGTTGLSLLVASLAYGPAPEAAMAPSIVEWRSLDEHPTTPPDHQALDASRQVAIAGAIAPLPDAETWTGPHPVLRPRAAPSSQSQASSLRASLAGVAAAPLPHHATAASRSFPRTAPRTASVALIPRGPGQPHPPSAALAATGGELSVSTIAGKVPVSEEAKPPLLHQAGYGSPSLEAGLEGISGSTCTGVIAVGMRAAGGVPGRPDVVPGQAVPAHAQFFRKESGALWVRFHAFGRPPLDLPVRFARNGMTWTGEYGIAYTVQAAGDDRLAGLASLVANDSARLSFGCSRSMSRSL